MSQLMMVLIVLLFLLIVLSFCQIMLAVVIKKQRVKKGKTKKTRQSTHRNKTNYHRIKALLFFFCQMILLAVLFCLVLAIIQIGDLVNTATNSQQEKKNQPTDLMAIENKLSILESYQDYPQEGLSSLSIDNSLWKEASVQKQFKLNLTKELSPYFFQSIINIDLDSQNQGIQLTLKESQNLTITSRSYYLYVVEQVLKNIESGNTILELTIMSDLYEEEQGKMTYKRRSGQPFEKVAPVVQPILDSSDVE